MPDIRVQIDRYFKASAMAAVETEPVMAADSISSEVANETYTADLVNDAASNEDAVAAKLSDLVTGIIQQTQTAVEQLLSTINDINACSLDVMEDVQHVRDCVLERQTKLEEEKDRFQQAASSVLHMLSAEIRGHEI